MSALHEKRRYLAPEVIQSSAMDCGPAALKSVLAGFGIHADYGRLREACNTDVDGTSIDTLEDILVELGLQATQTIVPRDFLFLREADLLPAIVVVKRPNEAVHFVVAWRMVGGLLQVMDPAVGRRWVRARDLVGDVYQHEMRLPADDWQAWARTPMVKKALLARMREIGVDRRVADTLFTRAASASGWERIATLDAAVRMLARLSTHRKLGSTREVSRLLESLAQEGIDSQRIPDLFWSVRPCVEDGGDLTVRGGVLVHLAGKAHGAHTPETNAGAALAPELLRALKAPPRASWKPFTSALRQMGMVTAVVVTLGVVVSGLVVVIQALLLRSLLDVGHWLGTGEHRLAAFIVLVVCLGALVALDYPLLLATARLGRRLDVLLRLAFFHKIPRIADQYFHSRLLSDMAERLHMVSVVRALPAFVSEWIRAAASLAFTVGALVWIAPDLWGWTVASALVGFAFSVSSLQLLQEPEMRAQSQAANLVRFYLDALLGTTAVRAHSASATLLRQQESLLVDWYGAQSRVQRIAVVLEAGMQLATASFTIALVWSHISRHGATAGILLIAYWALQIPTHAHTLAQMSRQLPALRNVLARLLEPLGAEEEARAPADVPAGAIPGTVESVAPSTGAGTGRVGGSETVKNETALKLVGSSRRRGVRLEFSNVTVRAAGHAVIEDVTISIAPGEQVAVVGESGAGKSSLLGVLLGWYRAGAGSVVVDGEELTASSLARRRARTAWVDPSVGLFNRRLAENLLYGAEDAVLDLPQAIEESDLREVIERLPEGLQTQMGEGGALISGGEGQRVRLGRAWLKRDVDLVLLDEPFRGLDREKRRLLLEKARRHWDGATLICVTHDVSDTLEFQRVVVIESGRIVEDGDPRALACDIHSRYHHMLASEQFVREQLWASPVWRRFRVEGGLVAVQGVPDWVELPSLLEGELDSAGEGEG